MAFDKTKFWHRVWVGLQVGFKVAQVLDGKKIGKTTVNVPYIGVAVDVASVVGAVISEKQGE